MLIATHSLYYGFMTAKEVCDLYGSDSDNHVIEIKDLNND